MDDRASATSQFCRRSNLSVSGFAACDRKGLRRIAVTCPRARRAIAVVEQQFPLGLLDIEAQLAVARFGRERPPRTDRRTRTDPTRRHVGEFLRNSHPRLADGSSATLADRIKHRMPADAAEPVLGVREIALAAVHDRVPEAARRRVDPLADRVRLVQTIVQQPHARIRSTRPCRRRRPSRARTPLRTDSRSSAARELPSQLARIQRPPPIDRQQRREHRAVSLGSKCAIWMLNS